MRDPAGAWHFNLTTGKIGGSDDLLNLYGIAPEDRRSERIAEVCTRRTGNADETAALANIVNAPPGYEHRPTWTVRRDNGRLRAANFACRAIHEVAGDTAGEVVLRGITHDIGRAETRPSAPPKLLLAQHFLARARAQVRAKASRLGDGLFPEGVRPGVKLGWSVKDRRPTSPTRSRRPRQEGGAVSMS